MMGCLHMHMLKNVSLHVIAVSITPLLFSSFIRCFHLAICASTLVTLIFILTLRVTSSDSRPRRRQSRPTSGSQGSKCEHIGGSKNFSAGPNTSVEFGLGVQLLRGSKYYVTDFCRESCLAPDCILTQVTEGTVVQVSGAVILYDFFSKLQNTVIHGTHYTDLELLLYQSYSYLIGEHSR